MQRMENVAGESNVSDGEVLLKFFVILYGFLLPSMLANRAVRKPRFHHETWIDFVQCLHMVAKWVDVKAGTAWASEPAYGRLIYPR